MREVICTNSECHNYYKWASIGQTVEEGKYLGQCDYCENPLADKDLHLKQVMFDDIVEKRILETIQMHGDMAEYAAEKMKNDWISKIGFKGANQSFIAFEIKVWREVYNKIRLTN